MEIEEGTVRFTIGRTIFEGTGCQGNYRGIDTAIAFIRVG